MSQSHPTDFPIFIARRRRSFERVSFASVSFLFDRYQRSPAMVSTCAETNKMAARRFPISTLKGTPSIVFKKVLMSRNTQAARTLLLNESFGVLSTISLDLPGYPFGSIVPYCVDELCRPIIYISHIAQHTKNIL